MQLITDNISVSRDIAGSHSSTKVQGDQDKEMAPRRERGPQAPLVSDKGLLSPTGHWSAKWSRDPGRVGMQSTNLGPGFG